MGVVIKELRGLFLCVPLALGLILASCGDDTKTPPSPAGKGSAGSAGGTSKDPAAGPPISQLHPYGRIGDDGPIEFVAANCAKCHGIEASNHPPERAIKYRGEDEKLRTIINTMIKAQAPVPPTGEEYEVLVAFHRSVIMHQPFITVLDAKMPDSKNDPTMTLEGEVTRNTQITFTVNGDTMKVVMDGPNYWSATIPKDATQVTFTVVRDGEVLTLDYPRHTHSQDAPMPPIDPASTQK